ncbi:MMPL family transporter [Mycobacterium lepromatosis]|uniref:MMPL family transporter n=1 Tax=Mycobacterium lepromatosis TaxID=480418 RepID=UPI000698080C
MFHVTVHVAIGSGLSIAGATFCLSFARMPYVRTLGLLCSVGMLVAVIAAITLEPGVFTINLLTVFHLIRPQT